MIHETITPSLGSIEGDGSLSPAIHIVLLYDGHGEYGFGDKPAYGEGWSGGYFEVDRLWDNYQFSFIEPTPIYEDGRQINGKVDAFERRLGEAFDLIFADVNLDDACMLAREWGSILCMRGAASGLRAAFTELERQVAEMPSGDDDTFDYWPSGLRLLEQLADDLTRIDDDSSYQQRVQVIRDNARVYLGDFADEILGTNTDDAKEV